MLFEEPKRKENDQQELDINVELSASEREAATKNAEFYEYNKTSLLNYEELFTSLIEELRDPTHTAEIDLERQYDLKIKINGDRWDGTIDENIAKIVLKYQKHFDEAFEAICGSKSLGRDRVILRIKLENGSAILDFLFEKLIQEGFQAMDDKTKKTVLLALILVLGGTVLGGKALGIVKDVLTERTRVEIQESQERMMANQAESFERIAEEQAKSFERIAEKILEAKAAPNYIVKQMDDKDHIQMPTDVQPVTKAEVKKRYMTPRTSTPELARENVFDDFLVTAIDLKNPKEPVLSLECSGHKFPARLEIVGVESEGIANEVREAMQSRESLEMPLNVHIFHLDGKVEKAKVLGMGAPTEGALSILKVVGPPPN